MSKAPDTVLVSITFADDSVGVMQFVVTEFDQNGNARWARPATRENVDSEIARTAFEPALLPVKGWRFILRDDLPADRSYRPAWQDDGARVSHNMPKAREHHRSLIRRQRVAAFKQLDGDWMAAQSKGAAAVAAVEAKRKAWRDAPSDPRIEAAKTIDDLKQIPGTQP